MQWVQLKYLDTFNFFQQINIVCDAVCVSSDKLTMIYSP